MTKPTGPADQYCPLWRQKCSKVCQTCNWWMAVDLEINGKVTQQYQCAIYWNALSGAMNNARLDGIQRANEQTRNGFHEFKETFGAIVAPALMARSREHARQLERERNADSPARLEADKARLGGDTGSPGPD